MLNYLVFSIALGSFVLVQAPSKRAANILVNGKAVLS